MAADLKFPGGVPCLDLLSPEVAFLGQRLASELRLRGFVLESLAILLQLLFLATQLLAMFLEFFACPFQFGARALGLEFQVLEPRLFQLRILPALFELLTLNVELGFPLRELLHAGGEFGLRLLDLNALRFPANSLGFELPRLVAVQQLPLVEIRAIRKELLMFQGQFTLAIFDAAADGQLLGPMLFPLLALSGELRAVLLERLSLACESSQARFALGPFAFEIVVSLREHLAVPRQLLPFPRELLTSVIGLATDGGELFELEFE